MLWLPLQTALPLPPVSSGASCPHVELFPRSQRRGCSHFWEAWREAVLCCGLSEAGGLCLFQTLLLLLAHRKNGLCLHTLPRKTSVDTQGVLQTGCRTLWRRPPPARAPGPGVRTCSLHTPDVRPCANHFVSLVSAYLICQMGIMIPIPTSEDCWGLQAPMWV